MPRRPYPYISPLTTQCLSTAPRSNLTFTSDPRDSKPAMPAVLRSDLWKQYAQSAQADRLRAAETEVSAPALLTSLLG